MITLFSVSTSGRVFSACSVVFWIWVMTFLRSVIVLYLYRGSRIIKVSVGSGPLDGQLAYN